MARYCNLDELIEKFEERNKSTCNGSLTYLQLLRMIKATSTSDVVPKSDITRLQSEVNRLKKYDEERDIALHARLISETRTNIANEIFAEIENLIQDRKNVELERQGDNKMMSQYTYSLGALEIINFQIDELKKKYIKEAQL